VTPGARPLWERSLYLGPFVRALGATRWLSLDHWLIEVTQYRLPVSARRTRPFALLSEVYQLVFLALVPALWAWLFWAPGHAPWIAGIAIYRLWDIFTFALRWAIVERSAPLISKARSLIGFLLNLVEVVLYFAIASAGLDCLTSAAEELPPIPKILAATYSSVRTALTIGPASDIVLGSLNHDHGRECGVLLTSEVVIAFLLIVVVIASLLGVMQRGEREGVEPRGKGSST